MEKVFDRLGNEIKEGMSIYLVQTNVHQMEMGWLIPNEGYRKVIEASDTDCWILSKEYLVKERSGRLYIEIKCGEDGTLIQPLYPSAWFDKPMYAIKGISDKEPVLQLF